MKEKIPAFILSSVIITLLIIAGPAQAFRIHLKESQSTLNKGETLNFIAEIELQAGERLPINSLKLQLSDPQEISCTFTPDGTKITPCEAVTITKISSPQLSYGYSYGYYFGYGYNFGFGYGYGTNSKLTYQISLDTVNYAPGNYQTNLSLKIGAEEFSNQGNTITIQVPSQPSSSSGSSCITEWECSEWSECIDGEKTRTCQKRTPYCYADPIEETTHCSLQNQQPQEQENSHQEQNESIIQSNSPITGAVIGVNSFVKSTALIVMIVLVLAAAIILAIIRIHKGTQHPPKQKFYTEFQQKPL